MSISLYEVGLRDGLQNHHSVISTKDKLELIRILKDCGIDRMEIGSFVHPKRVPTMADSDLLFKEFDFDALVPNAKGLERAIAAGCKRINVFFSPSESFNERNLGKSRLEIIAEYSSMMKTSTILPGNVRVYISCAFGCPIEGEISGAILDVCIQDALALGSTVVICDTTGLANPQSVKRLSRLALSYTDNVSMHFHQGEDTPILANVQAAYDSGIRQFDCSIGGLGGCPFVPGAGGNLATEVLIDWAESNDIECDVWDVNPALEFLQCIIGGGT